MFVDKTQDWQGMCLQSRLLCVTARPFLSHWSPFVEAHKRKPIVSCSMATSPCNRCSVKPLLIGREAMVWGGTAKVRPSVACLLACVIPTSWLRTIGLSSSSKLNEVRRNQRCPSMRTPIWQHTGQGTRVQTRHLLSWYGHLPYHAPQGRWSCWLCCANALVPSSRAIGIY